MSSSDLCWPQSSEDTRNWAPDRCGKRSQTRKTSTMSPERSSRSPSWAPAALSPWQRWYSLFNYVDQHSSHSEPWTNKKNELTRPDMETLPLRLRTRRWRNGMVHTPGPFPGSAHWGGFLPSSSPWGPVCSAGQIQPHIQPRTIYHQHIKRWLRDILLTILQVEIPTISKTWKRLQNVAHWTSDSLKKSDVGETWNSEEARQTTTW